MILKISNYDLLRLPIKQGQIYYVTDMRMLYKDYTNMPNNRQILPATILNTENQRANKIRPVQGANYYVVESNCLWIYDTRWILKVGNKAFNTYSYSASNALSPVIIPDDEIQNEQGDKILDNNGLLGDGSVVVRDSNRIQRALIASNGIKKSVEFTSFLEDGILLRPFGLSPDQFTRNEVGSLHLGVQMGSWGPQGYERSEYRGVADYKGDMNIHGQLNIVSSTRAYTANIFTIPDTENGEEVSFVISCTKSQSYRSMTVEDRYIITIIPKTETTAEVTTMQYTATDSDITPDGNELLVYKQGIRYDAIREAKTNEVTYTLMGNEVKITLKPPTDGIYNDFDCINVTFSDLTYCDALDTKATLKYKKFWNVSSLLDAINSLSDRVAQLESLVLTQQQLIDELG